MPHYPLNGYEFPNNVVFEESNPFNEAAIKIATKVTDLVEQELVNAIVKHAEETGFTHLYLLDKTFIENALRHELERWKEDN